MAGTLRPSTITGEEAKYVHLGGRTDRGGTNGNGSGLFNGSITHDGTNSEGSYRNIISKSDEYVLIKIEEECNIYAYTSLGTKTNAEPLYTYVHSSTGKLKILQYDGTNYNIDVTNKYWTGRHFSYNNASSVSNGLTLEQFLSTELIDRHWQKIVTNLPPGQYKFAYVDGSNTSARRDDEWFLEKVIRYSHRVKNAVKDAIINNNLIQHCVSCEIEN